MRNDPNLIVRGFDHKIRCDFAAPDAVLGGNGCTFVDKSSSTDSRWCLSAITAVELEQEGVLGKLVVVGINKVVERWDSFGG